MAAIGLILPGPAAPVVRLTPQRALRFAAAITLFGAGMHYLSAGRKDASLSKMMTGAVLALASLLLV